MSNKSLIVKMAGKFNIDPDKLLSTLKSTAFKVSNSTDKTSNSIEPTNEQMAALLIVADQYNLNPFLRQIWAFPDKHNGIVPVVSVDGWANIINSHFDFDGLDFEWGGELITSSEHKSCYEYITCIIYTKSKGRPIRVTEYLDEIYRPPIQKNGYVINGPWQTHTKRMSRHKALIQGARYLGITGIYDEDEAERIIDARNQNAMIIEDNLLTERKYDEPKAISKTINDDGVQFIIDALEHSKIEQESLLKEFNLTELSKIQTDQMADILDWIDAKEYEQGLNNDKENN